MKTLATLFVLMVLALAASPATAQDHGDDDKAPVVENPDAVLHVKGLSCAMCARSLTNELKKLDAVDEVQVILEEDQRALLTFKTEKHASEKELREAVESAGFSTREVVFAASTSDDG